MDAIPDQGRGNILGLGECIAIFWASAHRRSYEAELGTVEAEGRVGRFERQNISDGKTLAF